MWIQQLLRPPCQDNARHSIPGCDHGKCLWFLSWSQLSPVFCVFTRFPLLNLMKTRRCSFVWHRMQHIMVCSLLRVTLPLLGSLTRQELSIFLCPLRSSRPTPFGV